ncbi:hypothetical protein [Listeria ilorinensis]|uniref:hypothetical protein n=1 Tax=Listeria ilorinensis TaxID=2867439 RepID=UPI001EF5B4BA|nr:hypothetical protein [Listeria ilorinensis]
MIYLKGITTADSYDNKGKYFAEIHEDIKKIINKLELSYDIYEYYVSHQKDPHAEVSICIKKSKIRMTFAHFFKVDGSRFNEGSDYEWYLFIEKGRNFIESLEKSGIDRMAHLDNLKTCLLSTFPIIINLSDSSILEAYSANIVNLSFIDEFAKENN